MQPTKDVIKTRLEYLRQELRAERMSYGELAELQSLAQYIDRGDVELLEPAGVPEYGTKCLYCENTTEDPHFTSGCCKRGMCDACNDSLTETEEQLQLDQYSGTSKQIEEALAQGYNYLCFEHLK